MKKVPKIRLRLGTLAEGSFPITWPLSRVLDETLGLESQAFDQQWNELSRDKTLEELGLANDVLLNVHPSPHSKTTGRGFH